MNDIENAETIIPVAGGEFKMQAENEVSAFTGDLNNPLIYHHQHIRVPQLNGEIEYRYFFKDEHVFVQVLRYKLSSRPATTVWRRANIHMCVRSGNEMTVASPDSMIMDHLWHDQDMIAMARYDFYSGAVVLFGVEYDGTHNDVKPHEMWGGVHQLTP